MQILCGDLYLVIILFPLNKRHDLAKGHTNLVVTFPTKTRRPWMDLVLMYVFKGMTTLYNINHK